MQRSRILAIAFYAGAVLIGAALGIAADRTVVRDWLNRRTQDSRATRERFYADLQFTDAQRALWDSIQIQTRRADSALMSPLRPQRDSLWKHRDSALRALLTPEQQELFEARLSRRSRSGDGRR